jgi:type IV pilus assembly protein PilB
MSFVPHILYVDDDLDYAKLIQYTLKQVGYKVTHLATGQAALRYMQSNTQLPDAILLDIDMPDISGYEVCESIQENERWSLVPVIFLSGKEGSDSRLMAFQAGGMGFLSKPVPQDELMAQLRKALQVGNQWLESFVPDAKSTTTATRSNMSPAPQEPQKERQPERPVGTAPLSTAAVTPAGTAAATSQSETSGSVQPEAAKSNSDHCLIAVPAHKVQTSDLSRTASQTEASPSGFNGFVKLFWKTLNQAPDLALTPDALYTQALQKGLESSQMAQLIGNYTGLSYMREILPEQLKMGILPMPFCRRYQLVAFQNEKNQLSFLLTHPFEIEVSDALRRFRAAPLYIATPETLAGILESGLKGNQSAKASPAPNDADMGELMQEVKTRYNKQHSPLDPDEDEADEIYLPNVANDAPLVRLVNRLIEDAYEMRASDIHIEPWEEFVMVRYRVDGDLRDIHRLKPLSLALPIAARIKVMASMNLAERRLPQDGRIVFKEHSRNRQDFDLRVATAPMNFGEKIVMRIIDKQKSTLPLDQLGFSKRNLDLYRTLIGSPYGMILHVGPTGSGKSMTLYSALGEINRPEINIQTAEDPIEYTLPRINQLQVHPEIGLTFARALRSYLRQDPDVILVGEIRDKETAHIAVEAALTGHLLLSTLHTNDAASTLTRFVEMGMEPFMISSSIVMICAQRLVRTLCVHCKEPYQASALELQQLGLPQNQSQTLYRPGGCEKCQGHGFRGRTGIHELMIPTDDIRTALNTPGMNADDLKKLAVNHGMSTLYWDAMEKVRQGITTLEEALSKVRPDEFESKPSWWNQEVSESHLSVQS